MQDPISSYPLYLYGAYLLAFFFIAGTWAFLVYERRGLKAKLNAMTEKHH